MRARIKKLIDGIAIVIMAPAAGLCRVTGTFSFWSQTVSLIPGTIGVTLRRAFYHLVLPTCEANVCISFGTTISHRTTRLHRNAYIGNYCTLGDVTIEEDALIASNVSIMNGCRQHGTERLDIPIREQPGVYEPVTIGADSWIGERAVVAANVGRHCIVGVGAVVTKPLPDYAVAVGVPARVIRYRNQPSDSATPVNNLSPAELGTH